LLTVIVRDVVTTLTRQEREQAVLDLYNQGKTIRDIAKEVRMSFRDIGAIIKKEEEKEKQSKRLENNITPTEGDNSKEPKSSSTQAYELFTHGRTPIEVAIELDLNEKHVTKLYREYWKLKGLYKLKLIHEEIKDDIVYFAKLFRLSKAAGKSPEDVVNLLNIANNDLPALENRYESLQQNVSHLEFKELDLSIALEEMKSQIRHAKQMLHFYRQSHEKEVSKMLQLHSQNMRLDRLLRGFKNNNKEYIKIQFVAKQTLKSALSDKRQLLKLALLSLIESWRVDPTKYDSLIHGMSSTVAMSKSTITDYTVRASSYHFKSFSYPYDQKGYAETLKEAIVNESANLYEKMIKEFTNETMTNAVAGTNSNLLPSMVYSNEQTDCTQTSLAYRHIAQTSLYE
jgi:hypothetical protein